MLAGKWAETGVFGNATDQKIARHRDRIKVLLLENSEGPFHVQDRGDQNDAFPTAFIGELSELHGFVMSVHANPEIGHSRAGQPRGSQPVLNQEH